MAIGPLATRVIARKAALLDEVADAAQALDAEDEAAFTDVIRAFIEAGFPAARIAHHTSVECSTVTRWAQGQSTPHISGRPIIARHLAGVARARAAAARVGIVPEVQPVTPDMPAALSAAA